MGREKGTLNISANFEPQIAAPFDSRIVVDTYADLIAEDTFISTDGNNYAYAGMIVSVVADSDSNNNGVYLLKALPTTSAENWTGVGKGISGITPEYSDLVGYEVGDIIVYISPYAEMLEDGDPLKEEGLYECTADTEAGENPETAPNKWRYLGKLGETAGGTTIIEIPGLQTELEDRVKYSDIGNNLIVTPNKQVNLDVTYLTVTGYSPAEDIQPSPIGEVKIGNTIWRTANEAWTDGGDGIYDPDGNPANVTVYGKLYTVAALNRLLQANPGYRLPNQQDYASLLAAYPNPYGVVDGDPIFLDGAGMWQNRNTVDQLSNSSGLSIVPSGRSFYKISVGERMYPSFNESGAMWRYTSPEELTLNPNSYNSILFSWDPWSPLGGGRPWLGSGSSFAGIEGLSTGDTVGYAYSVRLVKDI